MKWNTIKLINNIIIILTLVVFASCKEKSYHFDQSGISKEVLGNYLDRSVTMVYFLIPENAEGKRKYAYHSDDIRLINNLRPKFIGRSIYRWGGENLLNSSKFWNNAKKYMEEIHNMDSQVIFQACLFEIVTEEVNTVKIPQQVFDAFELENEQRNFSYKYMLNEDGKLVDHWRKGSSVPDISQLETQLWFYYLATAYIDLGCEAFHLGQVELIGMNDPKKESWAKVIQMIRDYAKNHARRNWVILDAHVPYGGMLKDGKSLIDFNSFPLRIKEIPEKPYKGKLEKGYLDALYGKSKGCVTPSGWKCENLPFLVEFDNYGRGAEPNKADTTSHFVWGWDEISWFAQLPEQERNEWLIYANNWLEKTDKNGHLQMPINRMISCPNETFGSYRANTQSEFCPVGYSQEETIKMLWESN